MSEKTGFTAGPWHHTQSGDLVGATGGRVVVWGLGVAHGTRTPETQANGALMTSAEALYAALEALLREADDDEIYYHTKENARDALSLARGGK